MNSHEDYVDIALAMESTGLSEKTLLRFSTSGLIDNETINGNIHLSLHDLEKTFGVQIKQDREETTSTQKQQTQADNSETTIEKSIEVLAEKPTPEPIKILNIDGNKEDQESLTSNYHRAIDLQEQLLEQKDKQLEEKNQEIQWLRERIEKLEKQAEQDKVLMLTSNRTLSQLIDSQNKKSVFKRLIPWNN